MFDRPQTLPPILKRRIMDQHESIVSIEPSRKRMKHENIQEEVGKKMRCQKKAQKHADNTNDRKPKKRILNKTGTKQKHSIEDWPEITGKNHKLQKKINENKNT